MSRDIYEIAKDVETQDNRATAVPIFIVQQEQTLSGFTDDDADGSQWFDADSGGDEVEQSMADLLEFAHGNGGPIPSNYYRVGYKKIWEYVQPFFTLKGAELFVESNRHNLNNPRIYVDSGHRNHEWQTTREHISQFLPGPEKVTVTTAPLSYEELGRRSS